MQKIENEADYALGATHGLREFYYGTIADWMREEIEDKAHLDPFDSSDEGYAARRAELMAYTDMLVRTCDSLRELNSEYREQLERQRKIK